MEIISLRSTQISKTFTPHLRSPQADVSIVTFFADACQRRESDSFIKIDSMHQPFGGKDI